MTAIQSLGGRRIYAAGGVLWRRGHQYSPAGCRVQGELEVLLVHRPKYDDWSFPKGKVEREESLPACAVREIAEETGHQVCLGPKLAVSEYPVEGVEKQVTYWLAAVKNSAAVLGRKPVEPASKKEIDRRQWVPLETAPSILTRQFDRELARRAEQLLNQGWAESQPVVLLRHGKAKKREKWKERDALRPLKKKGRRQAESLVALLSAFGISRIVTSPWKRCQQTVQPYLEATAIWGENHEALSETGFQEKPQETIALLRDCILQARQRGGTVICTHRPVLAALVPQLLESGSGNGEKTNCGSGECDSGEPLDLAQALVAHMGYSEAGEPKILAVERHQAFLK